MTVQDNRLYRPLPPGKRSSTFRTAYLFVALVEVVAIALLAYVPVAAYDLNTGPLAPLLLPGIAFMQVAIIVVSIVVGLIARSCLVRDHVEVRRVAQLYPVAMSCFCLAVAILVFMWVGGLFGPEALQGYLGGSFVATTANVSMLPAMMSGLLAARLHGLKKL